MEKDLHTSQGPNNFFTIHTSFLFILETIRFGGLGEKTTGFHPFSPPYPPNQTSRNHFLSYFLLPFFKPPQNHPNQTYHKSIC